MSRTPIDLGDAAISILDDNVVCFTAKSGTVVDRKAAETFYGEIEKRVEGNYSVIINRENNYRLMRVEVFDVINSKERLNALAIVTPGDVSSRMAALESPLSQKPFSVFPSIDEAVDWLNTL